MTNDNTITITLRREEAEELRLGLCDLLCWCAGFKAALGDDTERMPMGISETRELSLKLRDALNLNKKTGG